ncbi:glycosyltransferase family 4 protein [soil metagenome]
MPEESQLRNVLIITYYWPPSGGSGVQRWLKFVKYLPSFGWKPFVFTPANPSFEISDETLLKDVPKEAEVIHFPIWEPYKLFRQVSKIAGNKPVSQIDLVAAGKKTFFQRITGWIRGNVFIPDGRIFWVRPAVKFLPDLIKSKGISTIITTGPPHSLHLIGLKLKKKYPNLHWIADMRDPWSEWDFLDTLSLSSLARSKHRSLERAVLKNADRVLTIAPVHCERFEALGKRKVDLITNGFDEDDFASLDRIRTTKFTIRHIGMVDELRDPKPFMLALKSLTQQHPELREQIVVEFIGSVNSAFREFINNDSILNSVTIFSKPMPHDLLVKLYGATDIQLLVLAHTALAAGNLPGKFFEYLASGNFIFGVGPEIGDAATILLNTHAGRMIDRHNITALKALIMERFDHWKKNIPEEKRNVQAYSRRVLAGKIAGLLK